MTRTAAAIVAFFFVGLILIGWHYVGSPALPDERLAAEQWRVLAVAQLDDTSFLVSVKFTGGDIRSYRLTIRDPAERDKFLQAQQGLKKGRAMSGRAGHGRAGLATDDAMSFSFSDLPDLQPKEARP